MTNVLIPSILSALCVVAMLFMAWLRRRWKLEPDPYSWLTWMAFASLFAAEAYTRAYPS